MNRRSIFSIAVGALVAMAGLAAPALAQLPYPVTAFTILGTDLDVLANAANTLYLVHVSNHPQLGDAMVVREGSAIGQDVYALAYETYTNPLIGDEARYAVENWNHRARQLVAV